MYVASTYDPAQRRCLWTRGRVEVEDGDPNGGDSGDGSNDSGGGTGLSYLIVEMLREIIAAEIRNATSHPPSSSLPQPPASSQGRIE